MRNFLRSLFGQITWNKPTWASNAAARIRLHPFASIGIILGLLLIITGACYSYQWYQRLPKPQLVTAHITLPPIPTPDQEPNQLPLTIDFGIETADNNFNTQSTAPLNQINKDVSDGITLSPTIAGTWHWQSDSQLTFTPTTPWPAGQNYTVNFAKTVFAAQTKMAAYHYTFATAPLTSTISEFKFYQDLKDPTLKQVVATINFNYPVNTDSLAKKITLQLQALKNDKLNLDAKQYQFTLSYDENHRTAYLRSEALTLENVSRYLNLIIAKGVQPALGNPTDTENAAKVLIPSLESFFQINKVSTNIVCNANDQPEQLLVTETSVGVTTADLSKALHVYQLPNDYPATKTQAIKKDYAWQNPGEVTPDILAQATALKLQAVPTDTDYALLHSFKLSAEGGRYLYIQLDKGIRAYGDFALARDYSTVVRAPEYPQEISFLHKGALLALSSDKKLSVLIRGIPAVQFEIARVLPDDINHLVTQTQGNFNNPKFFNANFNRTNISTISTEIREFNNTDPSQVQYTALDLDRYLGKGAAAGDNNLGLFILTARDWNNKDQQPGNIKTSRLVLITDMGLLVKDNADSSHDVFVQSITQGTPVANAQVEVLGKNGLPIATQTTDDQGHVHFLSLQDFTQDREPTAYVAHKANDVSFIPYQRNDRFLNYTRFDIGGAYGLNQESNLSAYVFSDRGIYRPGDDIHVGMIIKRSYAQDAPAGLPLEITISDPRGMNVLDQKITLPASNVLTLNYHTSETAPTGTYNVNVSIVKDGQAYSVLGSTDVQVQEFLPDRMKIATHFTPVALQQAWAAPNNLKATVNLQNLFGTPAPDRRVTGQITLTPQALQFNQYPGYSFVDPLLDPKKPAKTFTTTLAETKTDAQGNAVFDLNLQQYDKATYQLTFFTQGFEAEGGRSVSTENTILVTPLAHLIGYKTENDLNFIRQNSAASLHFIAIDPQLKPIAVQNLQVQLFSQQPITTLVKKPNGTYEYQSVIQQNLLSNNPIHITEQGLNYALPTTKIGDYLLKITDGDNTTLSKLQFSVVGASQHPVPKEAVLSVKLNKSEFNPGDDITMQITAPYTGAGLITIERDKVYAQQWFKTDNTISMQSIHIPQDFQGDGYVNVAFIRSWNSDDIFTNPLSYAVIPFTVNRTAHTVHIQLKAPQLIQPGANLPITYSTDKPGKIIVYAVDEGILQVAHYPMPDPIAYFFQKHALEVSTQQTVDLILPNYILSRELSAIGGDGSNEMALINLNPFKRKTDKPVVYWSGIIDADTTPRQLNYSVPDYFNGTLHLMAVAVAANAVGASNQKIQVRGPFVINPNAPTFVAPGDTFDVSVSVANNVKGSGTNANVQLKLATSPELQIVNQDSQSIVIPEQGETTAHFKLKALDQLGSAQLNFTASLGSNVTHFTTTLSVRPAVPFQTVLISGYNKDQNKTVTINPDLYPQYRNLTAEMATNPLILVNGLQRYLDNFPFGCTEQLVSKAFIALVMAEQPSYSVDKNLAQQKINDGIQILFQRQMSNGAFSYWPGMGENYNSAFASIYAMHFLTEAKQRGYNVSNDLFNNGVSYLQSLATQDVSNLDDARNQAYAIYILTRNEIVTSNYLTNLQLYLQQNYPDTWQQDITGAYIAASYQMMKNSDEANRLISKYQLNAAQNTMSDFYPNISNDARYLNLLALHFPELLQKIGPQVLVPLGHAIAENNFNTLSAAYNALALSSYAQAFAHEPASNLTIVELLAHNQTKALADGQDNYLKTLFDSDAKQLNFSSNSNNGFFYQITQTGFAKTLPTAVTKNGLEIYREYRDAKGNVVTQVPLGSDVEVHIQIRALNNKTFNNIAIVDLLPGGFEIERDSVNANNNMDYFDIREDRILFFGSVDTNNKEIVYKIRATNAGQYTVAPIFASSMYDQTVKANGTAGKIEIK